MPLSPTSGYLTTLTAPFNISDVVLLTSPEILASLTVSSASNYIVYVYYRVSTETNVTLQLLWTSSTGPQTLNIVNAQQKGVGDVMVAPIYINAAASSTIYLAGNAGTANAVHVSCTVVSPLGASTAPSLTLAPNAITGLQSWLRSDLGVTTSGSRVTAWADQSGNSNGAVDPAAIGPTLNGSGSLGYPCLNFNGSQVLQWNLVLAGAKTVVMVLKENASPNSSQSWTYYDIVANSSTGSATSLTQVWTGYISTYSNVFITAGDTSSSPSAILAYGGTSALPLAGHILYNSWDGIAPGISVHYKGLIDHINQNIIQTTQTATAPGTSGSVSGLGGQVGAGPVAVSGIEDDVYEIIVYNKILTIIEQAGLNNYLHSRYSL